MNVVTLYRSDHVESLITSRCGLAVLSEFTPALTCFFFVQITYPDTDHVLTPGVNEVITNSEEEHKTTVTAKRKTVKSVHQSAVFI